MKRARAKAHPKKLSAERCKHCKGLKNLLPKCKKMEKKESKRGRPEVLEIGELNGKGEGIGRKGGLNQFTLKRKVRISKSVRNAKPKKGTRERNRKEENLQNFSSKFAGEKKE